jgi:hypothetical protein
VSRTTAESTSLTEQDNIRCPITAEIFFDPVIAVSNDDEQCGHCFEKEAIKQWMKQKQESGSAAKCPTCRAEIVLLAPALDKRNELDKVFSKHPALCNEVYFDLAGFQKIFKETKDFETAIFRRYIALLEKADKHLNSVIHVLASTLPGRDLLRKKLKITSTSSATAAVSGSGKYFFGNAEISAESLQMQINGKSICEWLSMTTAMDVALDEEQKARQAVDVEAQTAYHQLQTEFSYARLFLLHSTRSAATAGQRIPSDAINPILQQVVYGNENAVKAALEAVKSNPTQLSALLFNTGAVKDYSDRTITGMIQPQFSGHSAKRPF